LLLDLKRKRKEMLLVWIDGYAAPHLMPRSPFTYFL
jgi:hypothetical protein